EQADVERIEEGNAIHTIATRLQLDKIGIIRVSSRSGDEVALELLLFDVETGRRLVRGEGSAPVAVGQLAARVQSAVSRAFEAAIRPSQVEDGERIPAVGGTEPQPSPPAGPSTPVYEEWWFWTIIGGVIVAGVA